MLEGPAFARPASVDQGTAVISILDYGAGNLQSVANAFDEIGARYELARDAAAIGRASRIILPGVGHFGQMMRAMDRVNVRTALLDRIERGIPFLGICLGLQALFSESEEAPGIRGLGIFGATVRKFDAGAARVPHMGWNQLKVRGESKLMSGAPYVYFAHSYYAPVIGETSAICEYTTPYTAVIERSNIAAVQFHPEKSGAAGLAILRNFVERW
jgi:imidazole glycerol-phosphate synthase subunit HisH